MTRYIDADTLRDEVLNDNTFDNDTVNYYLGMIDDAPTADVAEIRRGEWIPVTAYATKAKYACSVCGRTIVASRSYPNIKFPYCHCGALMKGEGI